MVKGIDNAFDHVEFCFVLLHVTEEFFSKNWFVFRETTSITEFPGSNLLPPQIFNRWQMRFSGGKFATYYC